RVQRCWRILIGSAYPFGTEFFCQVAMLLLARADQHPIAKMPRDLNTDVSGSSKSIDAQCVSSLKFGKAQGMKPDNAGTEQRSGGKIAEAFRNRIDELFRSDD